MESGRGIYGKRVPGPVGGPVGTVLAGLWLLVFLVTGTWTSSGAMRELAYAATPPRVALTFDDGYGLDHRILEFLSSQGIRATAFVVGSWAQRNPALIQEMNALGWDICNHTQNHAFLTQIPDPQVVAELNTCQAVISTLTGQHWLLFRPPGGFIDDRVRAVAAAAGFTPVMWDLDSGDSRGVEYSVAERAAYLVNAARDGSIILFHFGGKHTYELVTGVVQGLRQRGFCFVTVPELFGWKNVVRGGFSGPGLTAPARRFLFAEGTTRPGFAEWILVFNPNPEEVAVRLNLRAGEESLQREYKIPPLRRLSINVNQELPGRDDVAAVLEASGEVVAERTVFFNRGSGFTGGFTAPGTPRPSRLHYFSEGVALEGFEEYLVLFNPGPMDTKVEVEMVGSGASRSEILQVPAQRRITLGLRGLAPEAEYSLVVRSKAPLAAERSRYFVFQGLVTGGSVSRGEVSPSPEWFFAEGTTREGFDAFLTVFNPCLEPTWVSVSLSGTDGSFSEERFLLAAGGRKTLSLNAGLPTGTDYTTRVRSLLPVVAERSLYFRRGDVMGGSGAQGTWRPAERWYFAEGCTDGGFSEWLVMENPWKYEQEVEVVYYTEVGTVERSYLLPAEGKAIVDVSTEVGRCREVSVEVRSSPGVVAERSMYFQADLGL
ncbi:MAG: polysaccharide deacetylase family protein [Actinomycetota bacterium]|nr:polysaccharide deacetylase family protein [Actinomycetota bacterium]